MNKDTAIGAVIGIAIVGTILSPVIYRIIRGNSAACQAAHDNVWDKMGNQYTTEDFEQAQDDRATICGWIR